LVELPTRFATSGKSVTVRLPAADGGAVVLRALGRNWTDAITPRDGAIDVELPGVRVPTTFSVVAAGRTEPELARIVVYPAGYRLPWDERAPLAIDVDSPAWLKEWLVATGLPGSEVKLGAFPVGGERASGGTGVLVVGRGGAGKSSNEFIEHFNQWQINVLVLEADWLGDPAGEVIHLPAKPECFGHALAELNGFTWAQSVSFRGAAAPWTGIANRWVWIDGPKAPLVEELRDSSRSRRIVFNYLPWIQQLGIEPADSIFLSVLKEASRARGREGGLDREFDLVWPPAEIVSAKARPVLAACLRERAARRGEANSEQKTARPEASARKPLLSILDLRGPALSDNEAASLPPVTTKRDWVVLGSDAGVALPEPELVKEPKESEPAGKQHVIHLADDALPSSIYADVRLMQVLTDQGVFIGNFKFTRREP
jgi:hypothetical protein